MPLSRTFLLALTLHAITGSWAAPQGTRVERQAPTYTANPNIGPGGGTFKDSNHFRVYGNSGSQVDRSLSMLEAAYDCFVGTLGFRSTGLSYRDGSNSGPRTKTNVYSVAVLPGAAGVMHSDFSTGMGWLEVQNSYLAVSGVVVHEYGHVLHYHQKTWVDQGRTGAWWETFANWIADTYRTSELCAPARRAHGQPTENTEINLRKTIGDSFQPLVDGSANTGNYYEAWPFFTYLTSNPDNFPNLGTDTLHQMMVRYQANSNETPLHTLQRVAGSTSIARIVGRYWAHMAYVDIGHPSARQVFLAQRGSINYANVDSSGNGRYTVKSNRRPQYMGANIIPLRTSGGTVSVQITANGAYTATLALYRSGSARYVDVSGSASVNVASGEEVSLVVANTPGLILYDPFALSSEAKRGLDYSFTLSGATVA
ncbi:hypothetical protein FZEAL_4583 [Fusarium zealandicum]|uniref:Dockerin type 1 n=1 Tax=Fusarium zealandicum TaxID=1053134 RepID=A0A8H4UM46_9HYPO|nr:hypothetical protein FZEAL_4583 [Fusarium zealandicum]